MEVQPMKAGGVFTWWAELPRPETVTVEVLDEMEGGELLHVGMMRRRSYPTEAAALTARNEAEKRLALKRRRPSKPKTPTPGE